jgi:hypothetical protein
MELTEKVRAAIDAKTYEQLLSGWRFAPVGDAWFQGESGDYWAKRMAELRAAANGDAKHVSASKSIGW